METTGKKAASHIEMVISFVMFALFVFFLLIYLNPIRNQNISGVLLDAIERNIEENASINLIEIPLSLKGSADLCFLLPNPFDTTNPQNIFAKDSNGTVLKFALDGGNIKIEKKINFYYLYYGDAVFNTLPLELISCTILNSSDYVYTAPRIYDLFFMPRIEGIKDDYTTDYYKLREEFNFPLNYDFAINITDSTTMQSVISMSIKKPEKMEILAREFPIEILYSDGKIINAVMNIQVW